MLKYSVRWVSVSMTCCVLSLAACGGGSSDSDGSGNGSPDSAAPTIAPYVTYGTNPEQSGAARLSVVSVPLPGTTTQVLDRVPLYTHLVSQVKASTPGQIPALEHAGILHFDQPNESVETGQWMRIDFATGSNLQPVVISADTQPPCAPDGVFTTGGQEPQIMLRKLTDARTAFVIYDLAGADGRCGTSDDVFKVLNYNGKASDAPITLAGRVIGALYDAAGNLSAVLQLAGGRLLLTNDTATFANPVTIASDVLNAYTLRDAAALSINEIPFSLGFGQQLFVSVFDSSRNTTVHRLDAGGRYSEALFTSSDQGIMSDAAIDGTHLYFVENFTEFNGLTNISRSRIEKMLLDGTQAATEIGNFSGTTLHLIGSTGNKLLFYVFGQQGNSYYGSYPKDAGFLSFLNRFNGEIGYYTRELLYLNESGFAGQAATLADEDGNTVARFDDARWIGGRYTPDGSAAVLPQISRTQAVLAMGDGVNNGTLTNVQLYTVANDGATTVFKAPDGSSKIFNGYGNFNFSSTAATDVGEMSDATTHSLDVFALDFDRHVVLQISNTPQNYEFPFY